MKFKEEYDVHMEKNHKEEEMIEEKKVEKAPEVARGEQECRNGPMCSWKRAGRCKFTHPEGEEHRGEQECAQGDWRSQRSRGFRKHQGAHHQGAGPQGQGAGYQRAGAPEMKDGYQRLPSGRWGNVRYPGTPVQWCQAGDKGDDCTQGRRCMFKHKYFYHMSLRAQAQQHIAEGFAKQMMQDKK